MHQDGTGPKGNGRAGAETRRRADARRNRERILNAAAAVFAAKPGASTREVATASGLGRSTLFRHFPTRDDLEGALVARGEGAAPADRQRGEVLVAGPPPGASELTTASPGELRPPGRLGASEPLVLDATAVLNDVPPHLVADQLVAEARRIAGVSVALYVIDIDGSHLRRLAGSEDFPPHLEGPLAVGPEIAPDALVELNDRVQSILPGCVPVPMWLRGRAIGVLLALRAPREPLAELARQGTTALELAGAYTDMFEVARRRRETSPAAEIQLSLLPPRHARIAGGELAGSLLPSYDVGSDWFDHVENRDGAWLAIADASGTGPEAAALSSVLLGALRAARRSGADIEQAVAGMNVVVGQIGAPDFTATGIVAHWHAPTSALRWVNCAHPAPLLVGADGTVEQLKGAEHPPFGRPGAEHEPRTERRVLRAGERLILLTDGVSERRTASGRPFGTEGIRGALSAARGPSAAATTRAIQRAVVDASPRPIEDDAAVLVFAVS